MNQFYLLKNINSSVLISSWNKKSTHKITEKGPKYIKKNRSLIVKFKFSYSPYFHNSNIFFFLFSFFVSAALLFMFLTLPKQKDPEKT